MKIIILLVEDMILGLNRQIKPHLLETKKGCEYNPQPFQLICSLLYLDDLSRKPQSILRF